MCALALWFIFTAACVALLGELPGIIFSTVVSVIVSILVLRKEAKNDVHRVR